MENRFNSRKVSKQVSTVEQVPKQVDLFKTVDVATLLLYKAFLGNYYSACPNKRGGVWRNQDYQTQNSITHF